MSAFAPVRARRSTRERAQATVEFALVLPMVLLLFVLLINVALVVRDEALVVHVAREAARTSSLGGSTSDVRSSAIQRGAPPDAVVVIDRADGLVSVKVEWSMRTRLLFANRIRIPLAVSHAVTMRVERPGL